MSIFALFFALTLMFIIPVYVLYKPPDILIRYFRYKWPQVLFKVDLKSSEKMVALTLDDAPTEYTSSVLDLLRENDSKATFFVIGSQGESARSTLADIVQQGHELGNHARFDEPSRSLKLDVLEAQIKRVDNLIERVYMDVQRQRSGKFFRPGSGFFTQRMLDSVQSLGYQTALGNIYPHDPQIPYWRLNARHILSMAKPGGIIICHDRRSWTLPMLAKVLPELKRRGYSIVTLSELMNHAV